MKYNLTRPVLCVLLLQDGKFYHKDIEKVWADYPANMHTWLLRLTEEFDLTFPLHQEEANLVPCLLPDKEPKVEMVT